MENNLKNLIHSKRKQKPNGYITVNKQEICHQTLKFELGNELELNQTLTMIRFQENKWASVIIEYLSALLFFPRPGKQRSTRKGQTTNKLGSSYSHNSGGDKVKTATGPSNA